jgi:GNAT superfamily N-acetyltransferase
MDDKIRIRPALSQEAPLLAELIIAAFSVYRGRLVPESSALSETPAGIAEQMAGGTRAAIAELASGPVGCVLFQARQENDVYLGRLAVLPGHQGRGIARRLIDHVETAARGLGARTVTLGVRLALAANQRLFTACGYREIGRTAHPGFRDPTSMDMRKWL